MRFLRERVGPLSRERLRTIAARSGWLIETPDTLRAGFGDAVDVLTLTGGLGERTDVRSLLRRHDLRGDDGPAGTGVVALGALPFDREAPGRLEVPRYLITQTRDEGAWLTSLEGSSPYGEWIAREGAPTQEAQSLRSLTYQPTPDEYAHKVAQAVELLRSKEIDKVVLARAVLGTVPEPLDAAAIAARLRLREPICTIYSLPTADGRRFVGATPELLAQRRGAIVRCHPLAGTIALPPHVAPDDYETWLLGSTKNLHEHGVVVDDVVQLLGRYYDDITVDATPSIVALRTVAHLGTRITAARTAGEDVPDALDVLRLLHPTAAVGGMPRDAACQLIVRLEQFDRGNYAGPVGWIDQGGDGEWWIGIRGVLVNGTAFEAWAGAGIVSESDPIAEREETKDKLASVLSSVLVERV